MYCASDLRDQSFGFLRAEEKMPYTQQRYAVWRCHCTNCGGEAYVNTKHLKRGTVTHCGCIPKTTAQCGSKAEDLTGRVFGDLTVLYRMENHRNGRTQWMCECACKNKVVVTAHELKARKTKSCGCYRKNHPGRSLNLKNMRFGRLTALYPTDGRDSKGSVLWRCRCRCGAEVEVSSDALVHGNYRSCGCLKREITQRIGETLHLVDDTCVEWLDKRKHRSDNTSGFRGVRRLPNGRYCAGIGLKKKRYSLGHYDTFEEAVQARLEAEQILHDGFVKAYRLWEEQALRNPSWAETHPFYYDVKHNDGEFEVTTTPLPDVESAADAATNIVLLNRVIGGLHRGVRWVLRGRQNTAL